MKNTISLLGIVIFCVMIFTGFVHAQPFHIENTTAHSVKVAIAYQSNNGMIYQGWYTVNPKAKATFDVPNTTQNMAWYAESPEGYFWGGDDSNATDITVNIVPENFKVTGNASPKGKVRQARFKNITLSLGAYHVRIID